MWKLSKRFRAVKDVVRQRYRLLVHSLHCNCSYYYLQLPKSLLQKQLPNPALSGPVY